MTAKQKFEANEHKKYRYFLYPNCQKCGKKLDFNTFQLAHRIPQGQVKKYAKEYGKEIAEKIIHHDFNLRNVCSLKCNSAVLLNPATHPLQVAELVKEIREDLKCLKK